jgi:hypothetical protein
MPYPQNDAGAATADIPDPMGMQVLRRWHEDQHHRLHEFHRYLSHVEDPPTREFVESLLSGVESELTAIEEFVQSHGRYSTLPGLEYGLRPEEEEPEPELSGYHHLDDDMGAAGTSGGELAEPTAEEAVEGIRRGPMVDVHQRARGYKNLPPDLGRAMEFLRRAEGRYNPATLAADLKRLGFKHYDGKLGQRYHKDIDEGAGLCGELSQALELTRDHQMRAHHHGTVLKNIAEELTGKVGRKDYPGASMPDAAEMMGRADDSENVQHPHIKMVKDAATFLLKMAKLHPDDFAQDHRKAAAGHAVSLRDILTANESPEDDDTDDGAAAGYQEEVGYDMPAEGKALADEARRQAAEMQALNKQLIDLHGQLTGRYRV